MLRAPRSKVGPVDLLCGPEVSPKYVLDGKRDKIKFALEAAPDTKTMRVSKT